MSKTTERYRVVILVNAKRLSTNPAELAGLVTGEPVGVSPPRWGVLDGDSHRCYETTLSASELQETWPMVMGLGGCTILRAGTERKPQKLDEVLANAGLVIS
jgi:hypothetical protein